jgi:tetratricopeptide (TPR) repeat protein
MRTTSLLVRAAIAVAFAAPSPVAFADELTDRARHLLQERQTEQAYRLLLPHESARAGDPQFDYLLGIAALDAGEPERAVFALERVLAVQPGNHVARAEIARAYLALGERDTARRELETVRAQSIPADAKATIDQFLSAIAAAETSRVTGFFEIGLGTDSNVNSATSNSQIAVPGLGVATLDPLATRRSDSFTALAAGASLTHKFNPRWSLLAGMGVSSKNNHGENAFDTLTFDGNLGMRWAAGKEAVTVAGQFQEFELDEATYRGTSGIVAQWQHIYDERRQATVFGQLAELRYPQQPIRDAERYLLGIAYGWALAGEYSPVFFGSLYGGREQEKESAVPHLGHDFAGVRVGARVRLNVAWSAFANVALERRNYGGPDPIFGETRSDRQADVAAGVSYLLRSGTTLITQVSLTDNHSSMQLNDFERAVANVSLRFNF